VSASTPATTPASTSARTTRPGSPFSQPKAVWAVAFACVISFMGIGLVDPILPALRDKLHASPSQVELLFTSYLVVTAVAMLVTGWVSTRIGAKRTLVAGLVLIVIFSALAGSSSGISEIVGFRAGWGLGNALFIATSLAVIVASASGGFAGAIILYETALGVGIALGPLVGGELGAISWRGPFFGVTVLMAIALIATLVLVEKTPKPAHRTSILDPLRALRHRGLLTMGLTALCYNWAFFTVLGYAPFPMNLDTHQLGYVFTGWGVLVAIFAIFVASRLERRLGVARTLYLNLTLFAIDVLVIALYTTNRTVLIVAVIISGAFIGINNTVTTQAVMTVAPVERPVASAAYGFIRFIGAGLAPYVAGRLAAAYNVHLPFYIGAGVVVVGIIILSTGHRLLNTAASGHQRPPASQAQPATAVTSQTGTSQTGTGQTGTGQTAPGWVLLAIDGTPGSATVTSRAAAVAANRGVGVEVMHVQETDVVDTEAIELEPAEQAERIVQDRLAQLGELGIPASSYLVTSTGDHGDVGRLIARRAREIPAGLVVVGAPASRGALLAGADALATAQLASETPCDLLVVPPSPVMTSALPSANAAASAG
jgi:MFS transporter, ACDE family, multidrug resistance protein